MANAANMNILNDRECKPMLELMALSESTSWTLIHKIDETEERGEEYLPY